MVLWLVLRVALSMVGPPQHYIQSVAPIDCWDTGGTMVTIAGNFAEECLSDSGAPCAYQVSFGALEAKLLLDQCTEAKLVVISPTVAGALTADYGVIVTVRRGAGDRGEALGWAANALPLHQKVRIHNYQSTMANQIRVTEQAQLQLLSSANVPPFTELVQLKLFRSAARKDHTLCGIGGDTLEVCPSFEADYRAVRLEGLCSRSRREGTKPLRFYYHENLQDNAVTTAKKLLPSSEGYQLVRNVCYVWSEATRPEHVALELFYHEGRGDHFATATDEGRAWASDEGYASMGVQGYVMRVPPRKGGALGKQARDVLGKVDQVISQVNSHVKARYAAHLHHQQRQRTTW